MNFDYSQAFTKCMGKSGSAGFSSTMEVAIHYLVWAVQGSIHTEIRAWKSMSVATSWT